MAHVDVELDVDMEQLDGLIVASRNRAVRGQHLGRAAPLFDSTDGTPWG